MTHKKEKDVQDPQCGLEALMCVMEVLDGCSQFPELYRKPMVLVTEMQIFDEISHF